MDDATRRELSTAADMAGLQMEFLELLRDAERYRWLRHGDNDERCIRLTSHGEPYMLRGELLDRCVDEGMAADAEQVAHTVAGPGIGAA